MQLSTRAVRECLGALDAEPNARTLAAGLPASAFLVGLTSVHWREAWKYGERAYRYCQHDAGHALGALCFAAAALGWRVALQSALSDTEVAGLLGVDRTTDFTGVEPEHPDLIATVVTNTATAIQANLTAGTTLRELLSLSRLDSTSSSELMMPSSAA